MRRGSQDRGRGKARQPTQPAQPPTAESTFDEAEVLQQRAERQNGAGALRGYSQAVEKFKQAIDMGLSPEKQLDAFFGLGESLQMYADNLVSVAQGSPEADESPEAESKAAAEAAVLYSQAVQAFRQVHSGQGNGVLRVDAAVNCANTLSSWAAAAGGEAAVQLLRDAVACYEMGLAQEDDALTWSNLADALVQLAEVATQQGQGEDAEAAATRALDAYGHACSKSDSSNGDDLPGLLHNWGAGLYTLATCVQDPAVKSKMLQEAGMKLQHSMQFERADAAPCVALGDVCAELADLAADPAARAEMLLRAQNDGYQQALNINRHEANALGGMAEVKAALAKMAAAGQLPGSDPSVLMHDSAVMFRSALSHIAAVGGFAERNEVRYNYACVLAQLGQLDAARQLLEQLKSVAALDRNHAGTDPDLAALHQLEWFQQLLR